MMATNKTPLVCNKAECTLSQTGICVLGNDPETCPDRISSISNVEKTLKDILSDLAVSSSDDVKRFSPSYTLSPAQVQSLMGSRYCKMVGILGVPGAGKTACLVSCYLLLANGCLQGYKFRDSKTVRAFEEISRGARKWNTANYPEQFTQRTEISSDRVAGFLHLRIQSEKNNLPFDLLFPDTPGEWSTSFVDENRHDRLTFLKGVDFLWLFVNGKEIVNDSSRNLTIHKLGLLIERLSALYSDTKPTIAIIITHKDQHTINADYFNKTIQAAKEKGFDVKLFEIASFSDTDEIKPGDGISALIDMLNDQSLPISKFWSAPLLQTPLTRQMLKFGKNL